MALGDSAREASDRRRHDEGGEGLQEGAGILPRIGGRQAQTLPLSPGTHRPGTAHASC